MARCERFGCLATALLLGVVLSVLVAPAAACTWVGSWSVSANPVAGFPLDTLTPNDPDENAFTSEDVARHVRNQGPIGTRVSTTSTFQCVDARGDEPMLGTPGGDFAEFLMGLIAWENLRGETLTQAQVSWLFNRFMDRSGVISSTRKFYFHTDEGRLRLLFADLEGDGLAASIFPLQEPTNAEEAAAWYDGLASPLANGCGHVRKMLEGGYTGESNYGPNAQRLAGFLIRAFFKYWWPTSMGSSQRSKVDFVIKQGALEGKAVVIVDQERLPAATGRRMLQEPAAAAPDATASVPTFLHRGTAAPGELAEDPAGTTAESGVAIATSSSNICARTFPLVEPSVGGSSVFVYHATAVDQFRHSIITSFFNGVDDLFIGGVPGSTVPRNRFTATAFYNRLKTIGTNHLFTTLDILSPADSLNVWTANYQVRY